MDRCVRLAVQAHRSARDFTAAQPTASAQSTHPQTVAERGDSLPPKPLILSTAPAGTHLDRLVSSKKLRVRQRLYRRLAGRYGAPWSGVVGMFTEYELARR